MDLIRIAKDELIAKGMHPQHAEHFAKEMFIGFPKMVAEKYAKAKFKEGAKAQRKLCAETKLVNKYCPTLDLARAIKFQVENAPEPDYK